MNSGGPELQFDETDGSRRNGEREALVERAERRTREPIHGLPSAGYWAAIRTVRLAGSSQPGSTSART